MLSIKKLTLLKGKAPKRNSEDDIPQTKEAIRLALLAGEITDKEAKELRKRLPGRK